MSYNSIFLSIADDELKKNGFFRKGHVYYKWMEQEQIVISFTYEMLLGNRTFRLLLSINSYVDGIVLTSLYGKPLDIDYLPLLLFHKTMCKTIGRKTNPDTQNYGYFKYSETAFKEDLENELVFYCNTYINDIAEIDSLEKLFIYKDKIRSYINKDSDNDKLFFPDDSLLYESLALKKYEYALSFVKYRINTQKLTLERVNLEHERWKNDRRIKSLNDTRIERINDSLIHYTSICKSIENCDTEAIHDLLTDNIIECKKAYSNYFRRQTSNKTIS